MSPRRRRSRTELPLIYQWPTLIVLLVVAVFAVHGSWEVYKKADRAHEKRDQTHQELQELSAQKASLQSDITALQSERGIEAQIREKYSVVKEGEEVVVIVDAQPANGSKNDNGTEGSWWESIQNFFSF